MHASMNTLGFDKSEAATRVVVAMSGGVDSSVVAAMLSAQGYEVIGITLQLYDHGAAVGRKGACCAGADIHDARRVADRLGIAHYVLDYESRFREAVIDDFADAYLRGETPIPCVRCNQEVKFADLLMTARDLGADCLATGHYVQQIGGQLHRAVDSARDQSYFLFATTARQLDYLRFPLGGLTKPQVRALAQEHHLVVADKPDSQDICFVPGGKYADVVKKLRPQADQAGDIVDLDGTVLGRHRGIIHYTVGQRRGLEIGGLAEPLYVVGVDAQANQVIVGPRMALATAEAILTEVNWLGAPLEHGQSVTLTARVRSTTAPTPARLHWSGQGASVLKFDSPEYGVSPGQAAVFYDGTRVLGGGWISSTTSVMARDKAIARHGVPA